jgi:hypothetical protein
MTSPKPIIRSATSADLDEFYGDDRPSASMRAIVVELDGKVAGVAGLSYHGDQMTAFSVMHDSLKKYPVTIMKAAKRFAAIMNKHGQGALAVASIDEDGSDRFLKHVGFTFIGVTSDGRIYQWAQQQYR